MERKIKMSKIERIIKKFLEGNIDDEELSKYVSDINRFKEAIKNKEPIYNSQELAKVLNVSSMTISKFVNKVPNEYKVKPLIQSGRSYGFGTKEMELFRKNMYELRETNYRRSSLKNEVFKILIIIPTALYKEALLLAKKSNTTFTAYLINALIYYNLSLKNKIKQDDNNKNLIYNLEIPGNLIDIISKKIATPEYSSQDYIKDLIKKDLQEKDLLL